jgi:hypothetical protein
MIRFFGALIFPLKHAGALTWIQSTVLQKTLSEDSAKSLKVFLSGISMSETLHLRADWQPFAEQYALKRSFFDKAFKSASLRFFWQTGAFANDADAMKAVINGKTIFASIRFTSVLLMFR